MGFLKNVKAIKDAMAQGMSGAGPTEEQLAALTPEQRANYEAQMARAQAQVQQGQSEFDARVEADLAARPLRGPAGDYVHGPDPRLLQQQMQEAMQGGIGSYMKASWKATGPAAGRRTAPTPEATFADRGQQYQHEWQAREAARAPYLAPARFPVMFSRIATRARDQLADISNHLAASGLSGRPELVFGVYPVPDHIGSNLGREKSRYLEWDVVHAAAEPLPPADPPGSTLLAAGTTWVSRASGQASVLDEDLAVTFLAAAGIGPERCPGVTRLIRTVDRSSGEDGGPSYTMIHVPGVFILGPPELGDDARDQLAAGIPLNLAEGPPAGVHVEVLNWRAVRKAVHPNSQKPFPVPSPFAYLPSTPQELLKAYIDIVGVNPFDTYGAAVTVDEPYNIRTREEGWVTVDKNWGMKQPSVDGKDRGRIHGASRVVITYRDRPEYVEGRARWDAFENEVMQSNLAQRGSARQPVESMEFGSLGAGTRRILNAAIKTADVLSWGDNSTDFERLPPNRYCWPPTDIR